MIIPAPIRALMAIYTIIVATEVFMVEKKSNDLWWAWRNGPAGAYGLFLVWSICLIIDFFLFYLDAYDDAYNLLHWEYFKNVGLRNEYVTSGYAVFCFVAVTLKNWFKKELTFVGYIKFGIGVLVLVLVFLYTDLYTDMLITNGHINLFGKIVRP